MIDGAGAPPEPPDDQGNRNVENAVLFGFLVVMVAAGIWLRRYAISPLLT